MNYSKSWQILDSTGNVIHTGSADQMDSAWDFMTKSLEELYAHFEGDISMEELQSGIDKWRKPVIGELSLVEVHQRSLPTNVRLMQEDKSFASKRVSEQLEYLHSINIAYQKGDLLKSRYDELYESAQSRLLDFREIATK